MNTANLKYTVTELPTLFTHNGMEYYLVSFKAAPGLVSSTEQDAMDALVHGGHVPAAIRGTEVLDLLDRHAEKERGWITLFDCREDMKGKVGFFTFNEIPLSHDGLCFYPLTHGGGSGDHQDALCWRKAK